MNLLRLLPIDVNAIGKRAALMAIAGISVAILMMVAIEEAAGVARYTLEPITGRVAASLLVVAALFLTIAAVICVVAWAMKRRKAEAVARDTVQTLAAIAPVALSVLSGQKNIVRLSGLLAIAAFAYAAGRIRTNDT